MSVLKILPIVIVSALIASACAKSESTAEPANSNSAAAPAAQPAQAGNNAVGSGAGSPTATAPNQTAPAPPPAAPAGGEAQPARAKNSSSPAKIDAVALFKAQNCVVCHGVDGKGKVKGTPDFTNADWQKKQTDKELAAIIRIGKKPMPPYESKLSDPEIKALVTYVRSLAK